MSLRAPDAAPRRLPAVASTAHDHHRILAGPALADGAEPHHAHIGRLGPLPRERPSDLIAQIEQSGLLGRGGAGFPVGRKWRAMAERRGHARPVVLANGAEGEPASAKDRTLMATRPHLVIDGAVLAAAAIGAHEIVFYVGREHDAAVRAMGQAMAERANAGHVPMRLVTAPIGYVAGEATAAVHYVNDLDARPTSTPPRMSERGVDGRPTLVQNVESLAHVALIARFGPAWYRSVGRNGAAGTALVTIGGPVARPGVYEIELGTRLRDVLPAAGGTTGPVSALALGGYFGSWVRSADAWDLRMDPLALRERSLSFGCGMVELLAGDECGVRATAGIMTFMARSSAGQCGPCVLGLGAIGDAVARIASDVAEPTDLERLEAWTGRLAGRGACRHPDGAAQLMSSALDVFGADFASHATRGRCDVPGVAEDAA
ncbi:MAG TPA: NADH-ubiquinone oxidoreductase-F iron-sulfur binding region domain-containing protein [Candidatus Limnocylindrales bacterium]|nr:NADH-ubiquinone oxidoreductase-F iron-sulfur binding region domain-containing protein [Candidatus Limnocylindrales bacterium]